MIKHKTKLFAALFCLKLTTRLNQPDLKPTYNLSLAIKSKNKLGINAFGWMLEAFDRKISKYHEKMCSGIDARF